MAKDIFQITRNNVANRANNKGPGPKSNYKKIRMMAFIFPTPK